MFPDRYHATIITTPTQARHALSYVLNNFRKHRQDLSAPAADWNVDWYSSGITFTGWVEYGDSPWLWSWPRIYDLLLTYQPSSWLLREGWKKAGTISCHEIPAVRC